MQAKLGKLKYCFRKIFLGSESSGTRPYFTVSNLSGIIDTATITYNKNGIIRRTIAYNRGWVSSEVGAEVL
jgi:hypothetical protein